MSSKSHQQNCKPRRLTLDRLRSYVETALQSQQFVDEVRLCVDISLILRDAADQDANALASDFEFWESKRRQKPGEHSNEDFAHLIVEEIFNKPGFHLSAYIGEAPLNAYLHFFLTSEVWKNNKHVRRNRKVIREGLIQALKLKFGELPQRLDSLRVLRDAGLYEEEAKLAAEMENWIHPNKESIDE